MPRLQNAVRDCLTLCCTSTLNAGFKAVRTPSADELQERVAPLDVLTGLLVKYGVRAEDIAFAFACREPCDFDGVRERYRLRPLWAVYLAVTNYDSSPVMLRSLVCLADQPDGQGYRLLSERLSEKEVTIELPRGGLPPGATAVIPVAVLLGPLGLDHFVPYWTETTSLHMERKQEFSHGDLSASRAGIAVIGPALWPTIVQAGTGSTPSDQPVHELDLANVYTLSRYWACGSCPHLFFERHGVPRLQYVGELFARKLPDSQEHCFRVPVGVEALLIAEIEDETTYIEQLVVNSATLHQNARLTKGQCLRIAVSRGDFCRIRGRYESTASQRPDAWRRNEIISQYMVAKGDAPPITKPTRHGAT